MRVAYIFPRFPVLYATFSVNQVRAAIAKGVDVQIFSIWDGSLPVTNERSMELAKRTRYFGEYFLGPHPRFNRFVSKGMARVSNVFPGLNGKIFEPMFRRFNPENPWLEYFGELRWSAIPLQAIAKVLTEEGFDLIHGAFGNAAATAALALSRLTGIPFSFESHAYDLYAAFPRSEEKIRMTSQILTISDYNRRYLIDQLNCPPERITVFRVPIDLEFCDAVGETERDPNLVVAACRLHTIKGLDTAIAAIDVVRKTLPDIKLEIYGDGPLKKNLQSDIRRRALADHVTLMGSVPSNVVLRNVARAAVFMLPCRIAPDGDRDGIPTAIIEAMYLGTPVVSTKLSGIPEVITDGEEGYLTEPDDVTAISHSLETLMRDPILRNRIGENARARVREEYGSKLVQDTFFKVWSEIVSKNQHPKRRGSLQASK